MKAILFVIGGLASAAVLPAAAQNTTANSGVSAAATTVPLTAYLQLQPRQIERLDRLYEGYAARRAHEEASIAGWSREMRAGQSPTAFDARTATRLQENIGKAQQRVVADLISARVKALDILPPVQRAQLEAFATDSRFKIRNDRYFQLLLVPTEEIWQRPLESQTRNVSLLKQGADRMQNRDNGRGNYGVYGGYSYGGPQYGVYGSYGRGPIGVHAGIGRGGPSIGIGIGGIFGGRR